MSVFLSDEWFKKLENSAPELVSNEFSIISQYEISGTEQGKIRFFIVIESGQIKEVSKGKHQNADCVVTVKSSEGLKILSGEKSILGAFMQGDLKVEGNYRKYLLEMQKLRISEPWKEMCRSLSSSQD